MVGVVWGVCNLIDLLNHLYLLYLWRVYNAISLDSTAKIVIVGYGFKYLCIILTIVDDLVSFKTIIAKTGGIPFKRILHCIKNIGFNNNAENGDKTLRGSLSQCSFCWLLFVLEYENLLISLNNPLYFHHHLVFANDMSCLQLQRLKS